MTTSHTAKRVGRVRVLRLSLKAVRTGRRKLGRRWGVVRLTYSRRPPFWSRRDSVYPCRRRVGLSCTLGQGTAAPGVGGGRDRGETGGKRQARSAHVVGGLSPKVGYADCKPWDGMCAGCGSAWRKSVCFTSKFGATIPCGSSTRIEGR